MVGIDQNFAPIAQISVGIWRISKVNHGGDLIRTDMKHGSGILAGF